MSHKHSPDRIAKDWASDTAFVLCTGPSLTPEDVRVAERSGCFIVGVNDAYRIAGGAHAIYAADVDWWRVHYQRVAMHNAMLFSCSQWPGVRHVDAGKGYPFSVKPPFGTGGNSGYQAIQLAAWFGFRRVVLLGFDMGYGPIGPKHFFGDHPSACNRSSDYDEWIERLRVQLPAIERSGVTVINASRQTREDVFTKMSLEDAIRGVSLKCPV